MISQRVVLRKVMLLVGFALPAMVVSGAVLYPTTVFAQNYPTKPVRIVTSEPGSGLDFAARLVAQGLTASLGQQAIVDNRRILAVEIVAQAPADGYTLLAYGSPMWIAPFMQKVTYDPVKDFAPVTLVQTAPNMVVIHPAVTANSVKELIALAKARPGGLNYGSSVTGGSPHLAAELFKALAHVDILRIPYKGVAQALNDVIGGRVQIMFPAITTGMPAVKLGRVKALAVTSARPSAIAPELPTVAAAGLPGYEYVSMHGIFAPAGTPAPIIARLNREIVQYINGADAKERILKAGAEVAGGTPAEFAATIKSDMARMGKVIKDAGIRDE